MTKLHLQISPPSTFTHGGVQRVHDLGLSLVSCLLLDGPGRAATAALGRFRSALADIDTLSVSPLPVPDEMPADVKAFQEKTVTARFNAWFKTVADPKVVKKKAKVQKGVEVVVQAPAAETPTPAIPSPVAVPAPPETVDPSKMSVDELYAQHGQTLRSQILAGDIPNSVLRLLRAREQDTRWPSTKTPRKSIIDAIKKTTLDGVLAPPVVEEAAPAVAEVSVEVVPVPVAPVTPVTPPAPVPEAPAEVAYMSKSMTAAQASVLIRGGGLTEDQLNLILANDKRVTVKKATQAALAARVSKSSPWPTR